MPTAILKPHTHIRLVIRAVGKAEFGIRMRAEHPVDVYVLDEEGRQAFYAARRLVPSYGGGTKLRALRQHVELPSEGRFYIVILNPGNTPSKVNYEVLS